MLMKDPNTTLSPGAGSSSSSSGGGGGGGSSSSSSSSSSSVRVQWPAERLPPRPWFFGDSHATRLPLLDSLPELLGVKPESLGAQQHAVDGSRLVDVLPQIRANSVETLRTSMTHVVVWTGTEDVRATERMLQRSARRGLPGFLRADFENLLSALTVCCGFGVQPIIVRVATPNTVLCASVNDIWAAVAEKAGVNVGWVDPVWDDSGQPVTERRTSTESSSLVPAQALDYEATLARIADALIATPSNSR